MRAWRIFKNFLIHTFRGGESLIAFGGRSAPPRDDEEGWERRRAAPARRAAAEMGAANVEFVESEVEQLPFADASFDVVISNGVIDLIPDKDAVFAEIFRVLTPGGRIQIADVTIQNPVSAEGRRNIDLWTGWIAGALLEAAYAKLLERHGFERIETGQLVDTYARSKFEDTRRKAQKFGARGTTVKAYKPRP
jgi:arsenite methyltransferase